jgi:hypothetical protein
MGILASCGSSKGFRITVDADGFRPNSMVYWKLMTNDGFIIHTKDFIIISRNKANGNIAIIIDSLVHHVILIFQKNLRAVENGAGI